jgi:hypothetical protein
MNLSNQVILFLLVNAIAFAHYAPLINFTIASTLLYTMMLDNVGDINTSFMIIYSSYVLLFWAFVIYVIKNIIIYIQIDKDPFTDTLEICALLLTTIAIIQLLATLSQLPINYF